MKPHHFCYSDDEPSSPTDIRAMKSENVERLLSKWTSQKHNHTSNNNMEPHGVSSGKVKKSTVAAKKKEMGCRSCYNCKTGKTRQWVRGEEGGWLCHACGQYWRMNGCHRRESLWHRPTFTRRRKSGVSKKRRSNKNKNTSTTTIGFDKDNDVSSGATSSVTTITPTWTPGTPPTRSSQMKPFVLNSFKFAPKAMMTSTSSLKPDWPRLHHVRPIPLPKVPLPSFDVHFAKLCA